MFIEVVDFKIKSLVICHKLNLWFQEQQITKFLSKVTNLKSELFYKPRIKSDFY